MHVPSFMGPTLNRTQFDPDLPKLMLVDIVERVCLKTVVREIPGIVDCFRVKEASKDGSTKVSAFVVPTLHGLSSMTP